MAGSNVSGEMPSSGFERLDAEVTSEETVRAAFAGGTGKDGGLGGANDER